MYLRTDTYVSVYCTLMDFQDRGYRGDETSVLGNNQLPDCRTSYFLTKKIEE